MKTFLIIILIAFLATAGLLANQPQQEFNCLDLYELEGVVELNEMCEDCGRFPVNMSKELCEPCYNQFRCDTVEGKS